jgi:hypothetical protein
MTQTEENNKNTEELQEEEQVPEIDLDEIISYYNTYEDAKEALLAEVGFIDVEGKRAAEFEIFRQVEEWVAFLWLSQQHIREEAYRDFQAKDVTHDTALVDLLKRTTSWADDMLPSFARMMGNKTPSGHNVQDSAQMFLFLRIIYNNWELKVLPRQNNDSKMGFTTTQTSH